MTQITNRIITLSLFLIYALVKIQTENSVEKYQQGNQLVQDLKIIISERLYICRLKECKWKKIVSQGSRSHQIKPIQQTVNLECIDNLKFILKRKKVNTNLIFGQQTLRGKPQPQKRITLDNTVTYTDREMTFQYNKLKWKFKLIVLQKFV
ncbi:unnamed protein product [Paramecium primaurelia]|uniref:Transmembrane protein n=1 Tax=Paramecium primaurelia TaxID=5886 RepID=A0A8S1MFV4_PARPR|nr:unnamed protein product [Paramecium primaurelia]